MVVSNPNRLKSAGPIGDYGFPLWFEDANQVRLELVLDRDPNAPAIGELERPADPVSFPDNFPDEAFYFMAEAQLEVANGAGGDRPGRARIILALEAAFGGAGKPQAGANVVFARIRVRIDDLVPGGSYVVTHPYGVTEELVADDKGRVFETLDLGITEGDPRSVLRTGQVAPFLQWNAGAPAGYLGDGITPRQITGGIADTNGNPINRVEIEGAGIGIGSADSAGPNTVRTDLFTVQGRIAKVRGVEGVVVAETAGGSTHLDVHAVSAPAAAGEQPNQQVELVGDNLRIALQGQAGSGFYTGRAVVAALPANLELINVRDVPATRTAVPPVERIVVESAVHDAAAQTLTVRAHSSNAAPGLKLEPGGKAFTPPQTVFPAIASTPAEIEIVRKAGSDIISRGRQRVELSGAGFPLLGVTANAVQVGQTFAGEPFALNGSGSRLATGFAWVKLAGGTGTLTQATSALAQFTADAAGLHRFQLTVSGTGGTSDTATVDVNVGPALPADDITILAAVFRAKRKRFRIDGTINNINREIKVVVAGSAPEIVLGVATPNLDHTWSIDHIVTKKAELDQLPASGTPFNVKVVASSRNGSTGPTLVTRT